MPIEYDDTEAKAVPPIPLLLDTIDKQTAIVSELVRGLVERLDKVLVPVDTALRDGDVQTQPAPRGGSNLATRLGSVSSNLGDLGVYVNQVIARLEL